MLPFFDIFFKQSPIITKTAAISDETKRSTNPTKKSCIIIIEKTIIQSANPRHLVKYATKLNMQVKTRIKI